MRGFGRGNRRQGMWKGQCKPRRRMRYSKVWPGQKANVVTAYPVSSQSISARLKEMKPVKGASFLLPHVDPDKCVACGMCREVCPVGAITVEDIARVDPNICQGCGLCVNECPQGALSMGARRTGHNQAPERM